MALKRPLHLTTIVLSVLFVGASLSPGVTAYPMEIGSGWSDETQIPAPWADSFGLPIPKLAMAPNGQGIATWITCTQYFATTPCIGAVAASAFDPASGWGPPLLVFSSGNPISYNYIDLDVAVGPSGDGVVGWNLDYRGNASIGVAIYNRTSGWTWGPVLDNGEAGNASSPRVAVDAQGNAMLVWVRESSLGTSRQYEGSIHAAIYEPGSGWRSEGRVDNVNLSEMKATSPVVAATRPGVFIVAWAQHNTTTELYNVTSRLVSISTGWGVPWLIDSTYSTLFVVLRAAGWASGDGLLVWRSSQYSASSSRWESGARSASYLNGSGWLLPVDVDLGPVSDFRPLSLDQREPWGAILAGMDLKGVSNAAIVAAVYDNGVWTRGTVVWHEPPCAGTNPQAAAFGNGSSYVAWVAQCPKTPGAGTHFEIQGAWVGADGRHDPPEPLPFATEASRYLGGIGADAAGRLMVTLTHADSPFSPWWTQWSEPDHEPPPVFLQSPVEGETVNQTSVLVSGSTEPGARTVINGFAVEPDINGRFAVRIGLETGINSITVNATDASGNVGRATVNITYVDPAPGLWTLLNQTTDELAEALAAQNRSAATLAQLELEVANLTAAGELSSEQAAQLASELAIARANQDAAQANLTELATRTQVLQDQLAGAANAANSTDATIDTLRAELNETRRKLQEAQAEADTANARVDEFEARISGTTEAAGLSGDLTVVLVIAVAAALGLAQLIAYRRTSRLLDERLAEEHEAARHRPRG